MLNDQNIAPSKGAFQLAQSGSEVDFFGFRTDEACVCDMSSKA